MPQSQRRVQKRLARVCCRHPGLWNMCSTLTFVVSLAWLLGRSRRIQHALSRMQRRRASAGRIDSCVAGSGYKRRRYERRMLMSNLRTVANRPWARLEGFFPPKRVEFAFGQLRPARWESWPSLSHAIVSVLQVLYGRGLICRLKVEAHQPSSGLASRLSSPCQQPCSRGQWHSKSGGKEIMGP